ncbi:alpha-2-macroglobulin family protein [Methylobacterium platani]|uniref:Alpha-2-macroglobulin n=2 Tax=Methylobacterium platani TaxID=427683 RepID=A0A179SCX0_9HYPH|nr:alpha-2-macroglobulin [Methylobacterium platani]KMO20476.1 alpha-2-macroglobulin [Methylobacterium platani JCM 14648]OAS25309.1 alpha-2-macroglobulin [Methylobacterium platani]
MSLITRVGRAAVGLAGILTLLAGLPAAAQQSADPVPRRTAAPASRPKTFVRPALASEAVRLEARLKDEAGARPDPSKPAAQWRREAEALRARGDRDGALAAARRAAAAEPAEGRNWSVLAQAADDAESDDYETRQTLKAEARAGAYLAYRRALLPADEARALALLGAVLARQESWRPALDAYAASLALAGDQETTNQETTRETAKTYEALREAHGFRILDYKVDSDAAAPRACFTFSEAIDPKTDVAPFVAVSGASDAAVTAQGQQVCVDGLRHGERYGVVLRRGLPSGIGETLRKAADYDIYVRDRGPQVRFTGRNYVLPRTGQAGVPLVSVNAPTLDVEVVRIGDRGLLPALRGEAFLSQLSGAGLRAIARERGVQVWKGALDTAPAEVNREAVTAFPVLQAVGKVEPGLYVMTARPSGSASLAEAEEGGDQSEATQWFVVSDLGLTAFKGPDGIHVLARSLASAAVVRDAEIRLIARSNEVLATRATDAQGHAAFDPGLARGEGGAAPSLVVARLGDDYGFLDLTLGAFDLADRGVKGRPAPGAAEAYLFPERGVYRSGETVQLTALLRDAKGAAIQNLPLTLVARRPDGVEDRRVQVPDAGLGGRALSLPLLPGAQAGTWRVAAYTDPKAPPVGEARFLVEDYVPERIEVSLDPAEPALRPGEPATVTVAARYLYGAPGAGLGVGGAVTVQPAARSGIRGFSDFSTGLDDEAVAPATAEIEAPAATDAQGRATVRAPVPEASGPRPFEARISLQVGEPGGRAVQRSLTLPILPAGPVLGIRKTSGDLREGASASFEVAAARPDGTRLPGEATWTLLRVERRTQWYRADGRWAFEPVKTTVKVADGRLVLEPGAPARLAVPVDLGRYRLEVRGPGFAAASLSFDVGWSGGESADAPDLLDLTLDRDAYAGGETMRARLRPRFAGTATVAVVSDRVHEIRTLDLPANGATVEIPVKPDWGAGAYLVATAYRPLDQAARRLPGRAMGLAWFGIDREARALGVTLEAPAKVRPRGELRLPIRLTGLKPGEAARVTVAAVDAGILSLTRYAAPDPFGFFFGQKALSTEIRDLYGYLIDGMQGTVGAIRSGGDAGGAELEGSPPAQEPLARYSGVVTVGPDGRAEVSFPLPAFNGTARVMVTAWSAARVGAASADVTIRDPVVASGTLPRFLAVGDRSRLHVALDNVEGPAGDYAVDVDLSGPVVVPAGALARTLHLAPGGRASLEIPLTAAGPGLARIDLRLTGPGLAGPGLAGPGLAGPGLAEPAGQSFSLRIQPGTGTLLRREVRTLAPGASLTLSGDLLAEVIPGTGAVTLAASPFAGIDVPALLRALDRYPYGCTEQVVSRALPLLSVNRLAALSQLGLDGSADERVRGAIDRVLSRQDSSGAFGLWSAGNAEDLWLTAYATDFLTRARERGFAVPPTALALALDRLRNTVANAAEVTEGGLDLAYAAYVLARNGRPVMGDLRYLADTRLAAFATPLARGQIAAALALLGDRGRARTAFEAALAALRAERDGGGYRADYGSRLRDGAGLIALAAETGIARDALGPLGAVVAEERGTRPTSTQEQAWLVLAAAELATETSKEGPALTVDGAPVAGALARTVPGAALEARPVTVANRGTAPVPLALGIAGNPAVPEPAEAKGYAIERSYHRLDGSPADLAALRQNDRLVVVLTVTEAKAGAGRLLLVDRLPAGLEIDNPKLLDADAASGLAWTRSDVKPVHTEFRDDRFVAAYDRDPHQSAFFTVAYTVRAVTPGRYVHPAATIEDMYRPERYGRTAFGTLEVGTAR